MPTEQNQPVMQAEQKMSLPMLTAMVVVSMVGAGIFSLLQRSTDGD